MIEKGEEIYIPSLGQKCIVINNKQCPNCLSLNTIPFIIEGILTIYCCTLCKTPFIYHSHQ